MTEARLTGTQPGSDESLERALSDALGTPTWKAADRERVRAAVRQEWRATTLSARPQPRTILRHPWYSALAAALAVVALWFLFRGSVPTGAAIRQLARALDRTLQVRY